MKGARFLPRNWGCGKASVRGSAVARDVVGACEVEYMFKTNCYSNVNNYIDGRILFIKERRINYSLSVEYKIRFDIFNLSWRVQRRARTVSS